VDGPAPERPNPIPFKVLIDLDTAQIDDACAVFDAAIREWTGIIHALGVLDPADGRSARVLERLDTLAKTHPMVIREVPLPPNHPHHGP
jgi:hypothetical protein